jgi:hypothetical protein
LDWPVDHVARFGGDVGELSEAPTRREFWVVGKLAAGCGELRGCCGQQLKVQHDLTHCDVQLEELQQRL